MARRLKAVSIYKVAKVYEVKMVSGNMKSFEFCEREESFEIMNPIT